MGDSEKLLFESFDSGFMCHYRSKTNPEKVEVAFVARDKLAEALVKNISVDSGIMPYGTIHFCFENKTKFYYVIQREHFEESITYIATSGQQTTYKNVFVPNLIWRLSDKPGNKVLVRAIGRERFGPDANKMLDYPLYYVPFSNVSGGSDVCFGDCSSKNINLVTYMFFRYKFNHDLDSAWGCQNYLKVAKNAKEGDIAKVYKEIRSIPGETVKTFIKQMGRRR